MTPLRFVRLDFACNQMQLQWDERPYAFLQAIIRLMSMVISIGTHEHDDAMKSMNAWQIYEQSLYEPAISALSSHGDVPVVWKRRRPRWLAIERCYLHGLWRASQVHYRPWLSTSCCEALITSVPPKYLEIFHIILWSCVHPYKAR